MKKVKMLILAMFLVTLASSAYAVNYAGDLDIRRVRVVGDIVAFGTAQQPTQTCNYFGYYFQFDVSTFGGEKMFSIISQAKVLGKKLEVWYSPSTAPGTNYTNGCTEPAIAIVRGVAFN